MSTRDSLIDQLEPILSGTPGLERVKLIRSVRATDRLSTPILIVKTEYFEKLPAAPLSHMSGQFLLGLVSNLTDVDKAEDQLDDLLEILLPKLFTKSIVWTRATQQYYDEEHLCYDISITSIFS